MARAVGVSVGSACALRLAASASFLRNWRCNSQALITSGSLVEPPPSRFSRVDLPPLCKPHTLTNTTVGAFTCTPGDYFEIRRGNLRACPGVIPQGAGSGGVHVPETFLRGSGRGDQRRIRLGEVPL